MMHLQQQQQQLMAKRNAMHDVSSSSNAIQAQFARKFKHLVTIHCGVWLLISPDKQRSVLRIIGAAM